MNEKSEIAARLREEVLSKFRSIKAFAEAIQKSPQFVNIYLSGINAPGGKFRRLLEKGGLDVAYIMSGRRGAKEAEEVRSEAEQILRLMKEKGIKSADELRARLEREERIERIFGSEVYSAFLEAAVVKEKRMKYNPRKKRRH